MNRKAAYWATAGTLLLAGIVVGLIFCKPLVFALWIGVVLGSVFAVIYILVDQENL